MVVVVRKKLDILVMEDVLRKYFCDVEERIVLFRKIFFFVEFVLDKFYF